MQLNPPERWRIITVTPWWTSQIIIASQITSLTIVYSTVYWGADQRKHQSSVSLAFVRGIHRWPVNSPHKWPVTRKMFPFDDVIVWLLIHPCPNFNDGLAESPLKLGHGWVITVPQKSLDVIISISANLDMLMKGGQVLILIYLPLEGHMNACGFNLTSATSVNWYHASY